MRISDWSSDVCSSDLKRRRSGSIAAMQFIDLSIPITNDVVSDPPVMHPNINYMTHENTWEQIAMFFPGLTREDLPDGEGWAVEMLSLSTHHGTQARKSTRMKSRT